jgi:hypothetical protein
MPTKPLVRKLLVLQATSGLLGAALIGAPAVVGVVRTPCTNLVSKPATGDDSCSPERHTHRILHGMRQSPVSVLPAAAGGRMDSQGCLLEHDDL